MSVGLLLLHAWPLDARMWQPQIAALGGEVTIVAPDHPGFGSAPTAGPSMTMEAAAEHALREIDAAGLEAAVVCGLSLGGYVAFEIWRRARGRVAGLVLANTRAVADTEEGAAGRRALAERLRAEGNILATEPPPLLAPDAPDELRELVRSMIADQSPEAIAAALIGMAERPDSTPELSEIDVPTLVITSARDQLIPPEVSEEMAPRIRTARLEVIPGAGHLSSLEAPDDFNLLLRAHLLAVGAG